MAQDQQEQYTPEENDYLKRLQGQINVSGRQYTTDESQAYQNYAPEAQRETINTQQKFQMKSNAFGDPEYDNSYMNDYLNIAPSNDGYYSDDFANPESGGEQNASAEDTTGDFQTDAFDKQIERSLGIGQWGLGDFKREGLVAATTGYMAKQAGAHTTRAIGTGAASGVASGMFPSILGMFGDVAKRAAMKKDLTSLFSEWGIDPFSEEGTAIREAGLGRDPNAAQNVDADMQGITDDIKNPDQVNTKTELSRAGQLSAKMEEHRDRGRIMSLGHLMNPFGQSQDDSDYGGFGGPNAPGIGGFDIDAYGDTSYDGDDSGFGGPNAPGIGGFDIDAYGDTSYDGDDSDGAQFG